MSKSECHGISVRIAQPSAGSVYRRIGETVGRRTAESRFDCHSLFHGGHGIMLRTRSLST
jgi:hypothetical protein